LLCSWSCITATSKCSGSASLWHWNHGVCGKFPSFWSHYRALRQHPHANPLFCLNLAMFYNKQLVAFLRILETYIRNACYASISLFSHSLINVKFRSFTASFHHFMSAGVCQHSHHVHATVQGCVW
jgi:hypothetical protein